MIKKITFVGCGQSSPDSAIFHFQFSLNVLIQHCTFQNNNVTYTVSIHSSWVVDIASCIFQNNTDGAIQLMDSTSIHTAHSAASSVAQYVITAVYSDSVDIFYSLFHNIVVRTSAVALYELGGSNAHIRN